MSADSPQPADRPLYQVTDLTRVFGRDGRVRALDGVSLQVRAGQRLGIVGESGSGKSTLIRLMAALDRPTSGSVTFEGQQISGLREPRLGFLRAAVQLVFQDPRSSLNPRMTVGSIVTEPLRSRHLRGALEPVDAGVRLREVLQAVDLPADAASRYPHEFSGGQRQRIAIARALAPDPRVLIADEPVSALDVSVRAQVLNLLADLVAARGLTLIFVSHDLSVVRHLCDSVVVLRAGRIEEQGPSEQVFAQPSADYTRALIAAIPRLRIG
ncbi:MAG: ATP-binding cassette domain-containing protein [Micropruina sp.]|uniref:ABC transporter ATP-binding protein n=1 Tax=Micropruina sp. TaxID=2737536 RepID=UPI0039E6903C